ncbi:MAG: outer membrane beta-barrel protein [Verrucomicrobiota bacterium]
MVGQVQSTRDLEVPNFATGLPGRSGQPGAGRAIADDPIYDFNLPQGLPYAPPQVAPRSAYNLKLGSALVNFYASVQSIYTDNALQAPEGGDRQYDIRITPNLGASLAWQPNRNQSLRLDIGVGYQYSLQFSELNTLVFAPNSFLDYQFALGDVTFTLFNATSSGASTPPQVVGQANNPGSIDFNRLGNNLGLRAAWTPYQDLSFSGGYSFNINRGFNDAFAFQDLDQHGFNLGAFLRAHPQVTVGLSAGYSLFRFLESFQNDLNSWSVGPVVSYSPSENLSLSAQVGYSVVDSQATGSLADSSDFSGFTYGGSVTHRITRNLSHALSGGFGVQPGVGSNFSENYNLAYTLSARVTEDLGVTAGFAWTSFQQSFTGLAVVARLVNGVVILQPLSLSTRAEFYLVNVGTSYQITPKLGSTLGYNYTWRASPVAAEEFTAHSVNLGLNYRF